ncbi:hypothetical protein Rhein_0916 [Rheinheimera sp. A13L]|uniref:hypothetical protein n=1 Tax=Rheinheimera sp. A13L TaxID=506534 RepID=UPI0002124D1B|nr:hypothetical protein [Rheinheimera sp. A13L]EGM79058.1 hypothetical protein Rhein_0916 [Rheinheimera sp. A13L]
MYKYVLLSTLVLSTLVSAKAEEQTQVSLKNNKIFYEGLLTEDANLKLLSLLEKSAGSIEWISIKSKGGEVNKGMDLAEIIFKNKLGVEVIDYCLSSCANYVFSSASKRRISNHAVIGFHGGTTGMAEVAEDTLKKLPEAQQKAARAGFDEYLKAASSREENFFKMIGVDQKITYLGQNPGYQQELDSGDYSGWYYELDDLEKLGLGNISVIDPPWEFKQLSDKVQFFKASAEGI